MAPVADRGLAFFIVMVGRRVYGMPTVRRVWPALSAVFAGDGAALLRSAWVSAAATMTVDVDSAAK